MSWRIIFKADIEILKMSFNSLEEVKDKIEENQLLINSLETEIKMFASSNPKDIVPNDWNEQPIDWINNQITVKLNLQYEYVIENFKLHHYIEYLENQTII